MCFSLLRMHVTFSAFSPDYSLFSPMATAGDRRPPYEKLRKKPFRPVVKFMKYQVLQCCGYVEQNFSNTLLKNSSGVSDQGGDSAMFKQMTFTKSERQRSTATIENLPDDVLSNIFVRLLAKHVAQMRCVSKSWNALLSQSSFIKSHLNRSVQKNDQILLVFHGENPNESKTFTAFPSRSPHHKLINSIKLPPSEHTIAKVIGSVNGLICFSYGNNSVIHIWNPSLSAMLTLPPTSLPVPIVAHNYDSIKTFFHFGFDPKTDDYKVVKVTGLSHSIRYPSSVIDEWLQPEVYSMRRGVWELITQRFPSEIISLHGQERPCLDGHLHWRGYSVKSVKTGETIVAFDLGSLTFRVISLPPSILCSFQVNVIGVLAGKLCLIAYDMADVCQVWVMDEYGVIESWVKRHVFSPFTEFNKYTISYGLTSRGEILFEIKDCILALYNPMADKVIKLYFGNEGIHRSIGYVVEYIDSLVWITPARKFETKGKTL